MDLSTISQVSRTLSVLSDSESQEVSDWEEDYTASCRSAADDLESVVDPEIAKDLPSCSLCSKTPNLKAYFCKAGHMICTRCHDTVIKCPKEVGKGKRNCGRRFASDVQTVLTDTTGASWASCSHAGCNKKVLRTELSKHQRRCPFKPLRCNVPTCQLKYRSLTMLAMHLRKGHKMEVIETARDSFYIPYTLVKNKDFQVKRLYMLCGKYFGLCLYKAPSVMNIWIAIFEDSDLKEKFAGSVQLKGRDQRCIGYSSHVRSYRVRCDVVGEGNCLTVPLGSLPSYRVMRKGKQMLGFEVHIDPFQRRVGDWVPFSEAEYFKKERKSMITLQEFSLTEQLEEFVSAAKCKASSSKSAGNFGIMETIKSNYNQYWAHNREHCNLRGRNV